MNNYEFRNIDSNSDLFIQSTSNDKLLNKEEIKHPTMFGKQVRVAIIGPSGSGKTTLLKEFIGKVNMFQYTRIIIYAPITTLNSGFYQALRKAAPDMVSLVPIDLIQKIDNSNLDPIEKYFVVFDDVATDSRKFVTESIRTFFSHASKIFMHIFYLTQAYTNTSFDRYMKTNIYSFIIMSGTEESSIKLLFRQVVGNDVSDDEKHVLIERLNSKEYNFLIISMRLPIEDGRYRINNQTFIPSLHVENRTWVLWVNQLKKKLKTKRNLILKKRLKLKIKQIRMNNLNFMNTIIKFEN
jgi:adenylate kinase family enzyme